MAHNVLCLWKWTLSLFSKFHLVYLSHYQFKTIYILKKKQNQNTLRSRCIAFQSSYQAGGIEEFSVAGAFQWREFLVCTWVLKHLLKGRHLSRRHIAADALVTGLRCSKSRWRILSLAPPLSIYSQTPVRTSNCSAHEQARWDVTHFPHCLRQVCFHILKSGRPCL